MDTLRSELRKITSVPTYRWLALGAAVFAVGTVLGAPQPDDATLARPLHAQEFVLVGTFTRLLVGLLGVRVMADEHQHGTIVQTLATVPDRRRVLASKTAVAAAAGALVALVAALLLLATAVATGHTDPSVAGFGPDAAAIVAGYAASGALWAALGVGLATIVRGPVTSSTAMVAWLLVGEELVATFLDLRDVTALPGQAGFALALAPSARVALLGAAVLGAWTLAALAVGHALFARRDVRSV